VDTFIEQIVAIRKSAIQMIGQVALWFVGFFVIVLLFLFIVPLPGLFSMIGIFGCVGVGYGVYYLTSSMSIEYEYSATNEYFDIDRIMAKRKRKRILSITSRDFESFGVYNEAQHTHRNYDKRIIAANIDDEGVYFGTMRAKNLGHVLLVFKPDERVLSQIKKYIPRQVLNDAFRGK